MKFPLSDNLRTQRLRLRPLTLDDASAMLAIYAGAGVTDYLLHPPFADWTARD